MAEQSNHTPPAPDPASRDAKQTSATALDILATLLDAAGQPELARTIAITAILVRATPTAVITRLAHSTRNTTMVTRTTRSITASTRHCRHAGRRAARAIGALLRGGGSYRG
ncbi:hypothetical protein [Nocardia iowensis]|uniref:Uncharacterized protein n=1 Tax=Nocardia iowensis TaxID=204891 RepID=A0ABX8RI29_NOCIO|nr:hypothetical protein [Nocardia iowensis]QXN88532.1 hypothetical protein KV110_23340 [Nocardia iowensis]